MSLAPLSLGQTLVVFVSWVLIRVQHYLNFHKIETRPIISGNFLNQPSAKLYNLRPKNIIKSFPKSQEIEERGFFIGLPTQVISLKQIKNLTSSLLKIDKI